MRLPSLVIFDRDGTLNRLVDYDGEAQVAPRRVDDVRLVEGARQVLESLHNLGVTIAVATNQPDISRGLISSEESDSIGKAVLESLPISAYFVCPHDNPDGCDCRKPKPGLLFSALSTFGCEPNDAVFVGDRQSDVEAGVAAGIFTILICDHCSHAEHDKFTCVRHISEVVECIGSLDD